MIRVLYVLPSLGIGGAERSLIELIRRLDRTRYQPFLCCLADGGPLEGELEALGVPVHQLGVGPGLSELRGAKLIALARSLRVELIHSRLWLANFWSRLAARAAGARLICEERSIEPDRPALAVWMTRLSLPLGGLEVANAESVASSMRARERVDPRKVRVISGGVDARPFAGPLAAAPEWDAISVHRLVSYKGTADLLEAHRRVRAARPGAKLAIAGDGPERARLELQARTSGLEGGVALLGARADVPALLKRARLFVLLSHDEGQPNVVLEAMAAGLPVVATAVAGTPEVVADGETGLLVPPRAPAAAAAAIERYLADPALARAHGEAGRRRVLARFTIDENARAYFALYDSLLGPRAVK